MVNHVLSLAIDLLQPKRIHVSILKNVKYFLILLQIGERFTGSSMVMNKRMPERVFLFLLGFINISTAKANGMGKDAMDVELKRCK